MSVWAGLLSWAIDTAKNEAQEMALKALKDATSDLSTVLKQHAPDVAPRLDPMLEQVVHGGVAAIMTKQSK